MPDHPMTLQEWRMECIANLRSAHSRARRAENEARAARAEIRDYAIGARRLGMTLAQIGQAMNVSRQRVHEITR